MFSSFYEGRNRNTKIVIMTTDSATPSQMKLCFTHLERLQLLRVCEGDDCISASVEENAAFHGLYKDFGEEEFLLVVGELNDVIEKRFVSSNGKSSVRICRPHYVLVSSIYSPLMYELKIDLLRMAFAKDLVVDVDDFHVHTSKISHRFIYTVVAARGY